MARRRRLRSLARARAGDAPGGTGRISPGITEADYLPHRAHPPLHRRGDCYQVNFTFPLDGEAFGNPAALYQALRAAQPVRYGAFIAHAGGAILSRSPELFLERHGSTLASRPMKGTAPRTPTRPPSPPPKRTGPRT
jgi:para-aminobenzoate synthetase/4-amino-4-deoxychorismate lyase